MLHFGERDKHIPMSDVEKIRAAYPDIPVFTYAADHGFNCDERASYDAEKSAKEAQSRTFAFFAEHLALDLVRCEADSAKGAAPAACAPKRATSAKRRDRRSAARRSAARSAGRLLYSRN